MQQKNQRKTPCTQEHYKGTKNNPSISKTLSNKFWREVFNCKIRYYYFTLFFASPPEIGNQFERPFRFWTTITRVWVSFSEWVLFLYKINEALHSLDHLIGVPKKVWCQVSTDGQRFRYIQCPSCNPFSVITSMTLFVLFYSSSQTPTAELILPTSPQSFASSDLTVTSFFRILPLSASNWKISSWIPTWGRGFIEKIFLFLSECVTYDYSQ